MNIKKFLYKLIFTPVGRVLASIWLDPKYLRGRYFEGSLQGWKWVWRSFWFQEILGVNRHVPWPISPSNTIDDPTTIFFDPDDLQNFMHFGCYFSNVGGGIIEIGKGTLIAPNVGIITTNHDVMNPVKHQAARHVKIGQNCWLGMGCVILPGVHLGDHTIVGAGSIVTQSFEDGWCIIAGNPARMIRRIPPPDPRLGGPHLAPDHQVSLDPSSSNHA